MSLEERVIRLESTIAELKALCLAQGQQNSDLKERCNNLEIDVKILRQGGNL